MIDERGRGYPLNPRLEHAANQALCRAIIEQAITDKTFLTDLGYAKVMQNGKTIWLSEIEAFLRGKWCKWLRDALEITTVDNEDAIMRGHRMANSYRGRKHNTRTYEYNGESHTMREWAEIMHGTEQAMINRWNRRRGWANPHWLDGYRPHPKRVKLNDKI